MGNELILIVEDNERNRKLVREVLEVKGYQIIENAVERCIKGRRCLAAAWRPGSEK